jgi:hypothetical protein
VGGDTEVPAEGRLNLAEGGGVRADGESLVPGRFVTLTFSFERAAAVTVDVPVVEWAAEGPYAEVPVS